MTHRDGRVEIGTFWGADTGRLNNKANSTVGVCNSHATLCDPVSLPELLYWKHCGAASTEEAVGFLEPQGKKAKWQMIHRFKHHRMAQGKLGATDKYSYTVTQTLRVHTQTDKLWGTRILGMHAHMLPYKHTHSDTLAVSHFRDRFLWNLHFKNKLADKAVPF